MNYDTDNREPMLPKPNAPPENIKQYVATVIVCLGALCAGTVLSWTGPALSQILIDNSTNTTQHEQITGAPSFTINEQQAALVGSILTIGALVAALPIGILADKIGRKYTIVGLSLPFVLNWILIIFATNVEMVIAGRFFAGISLGGICVLAPMYIGELAEAALRGVLASFFTMFMVAGILMSCVIGSFANWVGLSVILGIFPIIFGISFMFMPESPIYLIEKNRLEEAEQVLGSLRGKSYDVNSELKAIQKDIQIAHEIDTSLKDIITNKGNIRAIISVCGVLAFQQLTAINVVVFYVDPIFKAAGSDMSSTIAGIIINLVQLIVSFIATFIIEKANRKFYLMLSSTGLLLSLTGLGMFFHLKHAGVDTSNIGFIPLGSCILFMLMFSIGYGPVPWILVGELFSPEIKGVASGFAVLTNWVFAFLVTFLFPIMNRDLGGHITFYIFAGIMALATIFVYIVVPETRGKSLAEIQEALNI